MADAELLFRQARRPLILGIGGGGDVVGALATAELCRRYDGSEPVVGGVTWERRPVDPVPGPRRAAEIEGAVQLAPGVLRASASTHVHGRAVRFAESHMAEFLGAPTVLVDVNLGPDALALGLAQAAEQLECDLIVFVDVGGDVLAQGHEPGLSSPLCDAVMLAAAARLADQQVPVLGGVFGIGCDAELTPAEVLAMLAQVAAHGGYAGARGLTAPVADQLEAAIELVPTEASAQAVSAFRGASGRQTIRGGRRTLELTAAATLTFYFDVAIAFATAGRLARAVAGAADLEQANAALHALGLVTELDRELEISGSGGRGN